MQNQDHTHTYQERYIKVGKREIHLTEVGSGPAVLMLHGGGPGASGMSNYQRNIPSLAQHFKLLIPDMPGYGKSTKGVDNSDPFGDLSEGMLGMLDQLNIPKVHAVGNSLGGACALRMALDHPDRVGRLVLMGPGGIDTTRSLPTKGLKQLLNYYSGEGPSLEKIRVFIKDYLVYDGSQIPDSVIMERYQASIDPDVIASPPLTAPKGLPKFSKIDFTRDDRLASMNHSTLVLWGKEDKVNRPSGAQSLLKKLKNCDLYLFSKTGHWVQWERADEFNAVVTAFFKASEAGESHE